MIAFSKRLLENTVTKYGGILGVVFIFFIFFILRVYHLGFHDLWYDEIGTISYAKYPWANLNAPLYWIVMHFWTKAFGMSEFSLRFPSVVFSFLSIMLVFLLGREIFNKTAAVVSSILMGLSPFHLWYAQEARDYSMVLFMGLLSSYLLVRSVRENKRDLFLLFALASVAGLYTNYFYIPLFFAHIVYLISFRKARPGVHVLGYFLLVILAFSFYLPHFLRKFYIIRDGFWVTPPNWSSFLITLENFILGYNGTTPLYLALDVLMAIFFVFAFITACRKTGLREGFMTCILLFLTPIVLVFVFSKLFFPIYLDRGLIIFSPYYYLILAAGIMSFQKRQKIFLLCGLIAVMLAADHRYFQDLMIGPLEHHAGTYVKKPIKPLVEFMGHNIGPKDIIGFTNESTLPSFEFYSRSRTFRVYQFFDPEIPDSSWRRPLHESGYVIPYHKINHLDFDRLWVISSDWERNGGLDANSASVGDWLDKNLRLTLKEELDGLWISRYERKN